MTKRNAAASVFFSILFLLGCVAVEGQTTEFTYQGRLLDSSMPPTGTYDLQFSLWDTLADGTQIGTTQTMTGVAVSGGIFTVKLDFGPTAFSDGGTRFLEIEVKPSAGGSFTTLSPRQSLTSAPHSIRSLSTAAADSLSAQCVGCVTSSQIESIDGTQITGTIPIEGIPTGSENYIQNAAAARSRGLFGGQPAASFDVGGGNVSGNLNVGGSVGIGTTSPAAGFTFHSVGTGKFQTANGDINLGTPNVETGMTILSNAGGRADVRFNGTNLVLAAGTSAGVPANTGVAVSTSGDVGLGGLPQAGIRLDVNGNSRIQTANGNINLGTPSGEVGVTFTNSNRADIRYNDAQGKLRLLAGIGTGIPESTRGITVNSVGDVGIGTDNPTAKLHISGNIKTSILQITGGSDLAENFEIGGAVKPGMIVAINPSSSEKLILARGAYNRRVVGVISGANNLSAGMVLPNLDQNAASLPVALSGRVWVYADATNNPIIAGDLLTSSATPGYAMKVTNFKRANGAVIGKALTGLKAGTGLVLVLVNLQ